MDKKRKILNRLLKGAAFSTVGIFLSKAMAYLYRIIVGRYIGPEAYGQLSIGLMVLGFAKALSGGALDNALKKYIPEYRAENDKGSLKGIVLSSINITLVLSIIIGSAVFLTAPLIASEFFKSPELTNIIRIFGLLPIVAGPYDRMLDASLGYNTTKYRVLTKNIIENALKLLFTVLLIGLGYQLMGAVWAWVLATFAGAAVSFYFLEKKLGPLLTSDVDAEYKHREIIKYSYPLMLSSVIGTVQGWADTAIIGYFMDNVSVGIYNAAYPTAMLITIPSQALGSLALSSLSEIGQKSEKSREKALKTLTNWTFALVFPAFLLMAFFSRETIQILFGDAYLKGSLALSILAFSNLISASVGRLNSYLKSKGYTKLIFYNTILTVSLNLILNIYLIPKYGITGAAISTLISTILAEALIFLETYRFENVVSLHPKMAKTIFSGLTAITMIYLIVDNLFQITPFWVLIPAGILFFSLHLLIFFKIGGLTEYDREIILTLARKAGLEEKVEKILKLLT
mgnify:FL=1